MTEPDAGLVAAAIVALIVAVGLGAAGLSAWIDRRRHRHTD